MFIKNIRTRNLVTKKPNKKNLSLKVRKNATLRNRKNVSITTEKWKNNYLQLYLLNFVCVSAVDKLNF